MRIVVVVGEGRRGEEKGGLKTRWWVERVD